MELIDKIYDCRRVATKVKDDVRTVVDSIRREERRVPILAVIQVGDIGASSVYVKNKSKACHDVGVSSIIHKLPFDTTESSLLDLIDRLNNDKYVTGILVQLPLPEHINEYVVTTAIDFTKDVDGFHPSNVGLLNLGDPIFKPCTAAGIEYILDDMGVDLDGKHVVVIGRSNIVGKPTASILTARNATVTLCHSRTAFLEEHIKQADIVVSAVGKAKFLTADMISPNTIVVDVGMNRDEDGKLCGDVDMDMEMLTKVKYCTPVPYGVGQMTVAMLMQNVITAYYYQKEVK